MSKNFEDLINSQQEPQILIKNLKTVITQGKDIELRSCEVFDSLLKNDNDDILQYTTQAIAELAKSDTNRKVLTNVNIISLLLELLKKDNKIIVQVLRALGNICYENEDARKFINEDTLKSVLTLLNIEEKKQNFDSLTSVTIGFILNLLMSNDSLQKASIKCDILPLIERLFKKYLRSFDENETVFTHLLTILNLVIDHLLELNLNFPESLCSTIVTILRTSTNPEISSLCLDILHSQSENNEIKLLLAKEGTCELIFELVEEYGSHADDEESRSVLKMACDLIVIILTEDECMDLLYNNGKGKVYQNMVCWLNSEDIDLLCTGILAIGNFARNDLHCIQIVENGIANKLLKLISKHNKKGDDMKLQHALLSTLRNLVIPRPNKARVLQEGLIDIVYPLIKTDQYIVIYKLLGTYRMIIDGQEKAALDLINRKELLEKIVEWCFNSDHLGVRGEAPRLLTWLIIHCHSFKPFPTLLTIKDCVKCIVEMISCNHAVMQNEAFHGLKLLCMGCASNTTEVGVEKLNINSNDEKKLQELLIDADIGKNLTFIINKYSEKMDKETVENMLSLLELLIKYPVIVEHFKAIKLDETVQILLSNSNLSSLTDRIKKISDNIKNGFLR